jgi:hypothetical protein
VQGATLPWFETGSASGSSIALTVHAGRGTWTEDFALSGGTLRHTNVSYTTDRYITLSRSAYTTRITRDLFDELEDDSSDVAVSSRSYFSGQTGYMGDAGSLLVTQAGGSTLALASMTGQAGISVFRYDGGTQVTYRSTVNDTKTLNLAAPVGLASVISGGTTYVYAASAGETGISAFRLDSAGRLSTSCWLRRRAATLSRW